MPAVRVNGVGIHYQMTGTGNPLVLVHGGWGDHSSWMRVVDGFASNFQVLTFDMRGHSRSDRGSEPGIVRSHEEDLASIMEQLDLAPAHVVGISLGASVGLRLASRRAELFRSMIGHEPTLFELLRDDPRTSALYEDQQLTLEPVEQLLASGDIEGGARHFFEKIAMGPGAWDQLGAEARRGYVANGPTFLEEIRDPDYQRVDMNALTRFSRPTFLTSGENSGPEFAAVVSKLAEAIPNAKTRTLAMAGHVPHLTHPQDYVAAILEFISDAQQAEDIESRVGG